MFRLLAKFLILTAFPLSTTFGASLPSFQNLAPFHPALVLLAQSTASGAPSVQLLSPASGVTISQGSTVYLSANASDPDGIDFVDFLRNGMLIGRAAKSPGEINHYSLVWIASEPGTHSIAVRATDLVGISATSPAITITVGNNQPPADTTAPTVQFTAPANNSTVNLNSQVTLTATAFDSQSAIADVEFFRNGTSIGIASPNGQPNQYSLSWTAGSAGQHSFSARATDTSGNSSSSSQLTLTVLEPNNEPPTNNVPNVPPTVSITSPQNNSKIILGSIAISANASDTDGSINKVEFLANNQSIGYRTNSTSQNVFTIGWNPPAAGSYAIVARATDNEGAVTTSTPIQISVHLPEAGTLSAVRKLPDSFRPGKPFSVEVVVTARGSAPWSLQEIPPPGWRVLGISHGGRYDPSIGKITYRPNNKEHRTLKYRLISRSSDRGTFTFTGQLSSSGQTVSATGDTEIAEEEPLKPRERIVKVNRGKRGKIVLRYNADQGARWVVEFCDSISQKTWTALPNATFTVSDEGEISIDDPDESAPLRFYRLRCIR